MGEFIKLTNYYDSSDLWVNPNQIWAVNKGACDKSTAIYSNHTDEYFCVWEEPLEVIQLIEKQQQN